MPPNLLLRHPPGTWRGFVLRVAMIAIAAGIVLSVADWFGISLDPTDRGRLHPGPYTEHAPPSRTAEP